MSRWHSVVLVSHVNWIFLIYLHRLLAIFTQSYYYIYNDFFSVIYWTEWCKLGITQIYVNFKKRFTNYLYEFQTSEKYISNYSQILQKLKKNPHKEVREERLSQGVPCSRSCVRHGMIACLTLKPSGRTHRDASHARTRQHDRRRGEADASASHGPKNSW